jgi:secondary thiamine-phosphate synthase enzyme
MSGYDPSRQEDSAQKIHSASLQRTLPRLSTTVRLTTQRLPGHWQSQFDIGFEHPEQLTMKSHTEYLTFNLPARMAFENITQQVESVVHNSGVREGLVLCNAMHITASVFINDDEPGLHLDYQQWLEQLAPFNASPKRYAHNRTGEDNADAHLKRQVMGREVVVAITKGRLDLGPWEQIFYGEFDGHRPKRVLIKVIGD